MHPLLTLRTYLPVLALTAFGVQAELHAQSQPGAPGNSAFAIMEKKWAGVPDEELLKAAQANDAQAQYFYWQRETDRAIQEQYQLGQQYMDLKRKLPSDEQRSLWAKWQSATDEEVTQAAQHGDVEAQIVNYHRRSNADAGRAVQLFSFLEKSAAQGFLPAEGKAALYYLNLTGYRLTGVNQAKGLELLRRSADAGWGSSEYQLGEFYLHGELVPPDFAKAVGYFQKAADQNGPRSEYELASLYANGYGVPRDESDAPVALLRKAAAQSNVPALHELAEHYRIGLGVSVDYIRAARCYQEAWKVSTNGGYDPDRMGGAIYELVDWNLAPKPGLTRELAPFARAAGIYLKATQRHDAAAMNQIGEWYLDGRFVPKDMVEAFRWFHLAADFGSADAGKQEDEIKPKLSPDQLEQALRPPEDAESRF